ncbi:hypothetical protein GR927_31710 [Mycolicibacterium sp. 3033]|nr:hypothetical protein [Mycolicibacterium aurantiacum]
MITTDQRESAERWFLERGLPYVLRPGVLVRRVWLRSAPALAAFGVMMLFSIIVVAVTGKHTIDIDGSPTRAEWFVLAVVVVVVPVASVAGWLVSRISDSGLRAATVVVSLALAALGAIFGGPSPHVLVDAITEAIVIAAILLCTASGVGAVLGWAVRIMLTNLASIGDLFVRALPVLLLTMLVFFNGPAWKMAATVTRGRLWLALLFLVLIAASFLLSGTMGQVRPILAPEAKRPEHAQMLVGTPFEQLPDRPRRKPLSKAERINVVFVLALSQFVRVLTVALSTGLIFLVFGLILISPNLLIELAGQGRFDGEILTMTLPIPQALIQMVMFLTALTFMYLAARAVGDKEYRAQYLDPLVEELLLTLVARDRYRTATATAT